MTWETQNPTAQAATLAAILEDTGTTLPATLANLALQASVDDLETRLTAARAGYLDNLSAGAVALQTSVDDLETRLTAARAGYLDNMSAGAVALASQVLKIDGAATGGLTDTTDSLAYRLAEIERHFHGWERWMCAAASANGEIHVADRIGATATSKSPFTLTSGNDTWGAWTQILGSSDTPVVAGGVKYDLHRVLVLVANTVAPYFLQIAFGATGDGAVTANTFSSLVINPASNTDKTEAVPFMSRRQAAGTKAWARCWCVGNNAKTLTIMFGLHEYEG